VKGRTTTAAVEDNESTLKDGVLTIVLRKTEASVTKQIRIKS
jgi:HSP20 family molecular chaperone IbpA